MWGKRKSFLFNQQNKGGSTLSKIIILILVLKSPVPLSDNIQRMTVSKTWTLRRALFLVLRPTTDTYNDFRTSPVRT